MAHRIVHHLRANVVAYLALAVAIGGGGGYAVAATSRPRTITVCADRRSGLMYLHQRGRCKRGQMRVTWNQRGLDGAPGPQGAMGASISVWAAVSDAGSVYAGQGLAVQHTAPGTYAVAVTDPTCAQRFNAPTVTVSDANPPAGAPTGAFPVAWIEGGGLSQQFTVITGVTTNGSFVASDHTFMVHDACS